MAKSCCTAQHGGGASSWSRFDFGGAVGWPWWSVGEPDQAGRRRRGLEINGLAVEIEFVCQIAESAIRIEVGWFLLASLFIKVFSLIMNFERRVPQPVLSTIRKGDSNVRRSSNCRIF